MYKKTDVSDKVLRTRIGPALKWALLQRSGGDLSDPIPGVTWGKAEGDSTERLLLVFHKRDELPNQPGIIVQADGVEFLVEQDWLCEMLEGKVLDIVRGKLTLVSP